MRTFQEKLAECNADLERVTTEFIDAKNRAAVLVAARDSIVDKEFTERHGMELRRTVVRYQSGGQQRTAVVLDYYYSPDNDAYQLTLGRVTKRKRNIYGRVYGRVGRDSRSAAGCEVIGRLPEVEPFERFDTHFPVELV